MARLKIKEMRRSVFHYSVLFFFIIGLFFFFSTPYLFTGNVAQVDAGVGEESLQSLDNNDIKIERKRYDSEENVVEILVSLQPKGLQQVENLEYLIEEEKHKVELPSEKIKVNDEFYVFIVKEVPKDWETIHFSVAESAPKQDESSDDEPEKDIEKSVARYTFVKENIERQTSLVFEDPSQYELRFVEVQMKKVQKERSETEKKRTVEEEKWMSGKQKIEELEEEKTYQTEEEKQETDNEISNQQSNLETLKKEIEELDRIAQGLTEKMTLLEQKMVDIHNQTR